MPNPDLIPEPFAQSGDKNTIPLERAIADPIYRASWKAGFPPYTRLPKDLGGEAPDGLDFNGVLNILSQAVVFLQKGNAYQFDASMAPYPIGALVRSNDNLTTYQSTVPNNSNNPNSNMTGWRVYNGSGFIVDNLTTNDSTKALSAAQGKALQDGKLGKTENAVSATKLQTARTIAILGAVTGTATSFDGSADVAITTTSLDATKLSGTASIATSGNAASATKLQNSRNINGVPFDGTANITLPTASTSTSGTVQLNDTLTSTAVDQALTAAQGKVLNDQAFGVGQSKQDVTASRAVNTTYTNSTGKPIIVNIAWSYTGGGTNYANFLVNGTSVAAGVILSGDGVSVVVPNGSTYSFSSVGWVFSKWEEYR